VTKKEKNIVKLGLFWIINTLEGLKIKDVA